LRTLFIAALGAVSAACHAQAITAAQLDALGAGAAAVQAKVVSWRRDIHQHPELSGQEVRTAALVADHLRRLGMEVSTGVGGHGVVGLLKGGQPGKTVALRADMDALPIKEATGLAFASKAMQLNMGTESFVAHACGHDGHTAMLMGAAEVLSGLRGQIKGNIKFIFQPAEEGFSSEPRPGESWGAKAMVRAGVMKGVDVIYGLHITPKMPSGTLGYRSGPLSASGDTVRIEVAGKQTHGATPWNGIDPIVVSAQIVLGLQTLVSRQLNISQEPAVVTIGMIQGGNRENIIPDSVNMLGTLRTFDEPTRDDAKKRITVIAQSIAASAGTTAKVGFGPSAYSVTANPAAVTENSAAVLIAASAGKATVVPKIMASEDFSEFQKEAPGFFYMLGASPQGKTPQTAAPNHSPFFDFDENAMATGVKSLAALALDYLATSR
jgi:amidohydrolase